MISEPVFLVGAEQSGTTLLRLMLDSHPEIAFAEEFQYAVAPIGEDGSFPSLAEFRRFLMLDRSFSTSGFRFDPSLPFPEMVDGFLESRRQQKDALVVGATIHVGFTKALAVWPNARFLHLVRDPRDVARARMREGLAGNVWHGLDSWMEVEDEWDRLVRTIEPDRWTTVRFSDLIVDHDSALTAVCRFIGVDYTAQMLDYVADTDYQAPSPSVAGDWRDTLTEREVRLVETRVGTRLVARGYESSGAGPLTVGPWRRHFLRWQDRFGRVVRRIEFFGLRLTLADFVARGLHHKRLQRTMRLRFNEVEKSERKKSWSENAKYRSSR